jgi:hypothetical protein
MFQATVYKIMIGAPSDIEEEIAIVQNVLQNWNSMHSEKEKIVLLPLHWSKDAYPSAGLHPQKTINKQVVEKSDLLVCIFGTRLGTPTDAFESGTIEEINEHLAAGKQVMIYFKKSFSDISKIDTMQLDKLNAFKKSIQGNALYWEFTDAINFEKNYSQQLQHLVNNFFIIDKKEFEKVELQKASSIQNQLSEFDIERLRVWTNTNDPEFSQIYFEGGGCIYGLGAKNQYEVKNGKEKVEWDDFFEKLLNNKFIDIEKYDKNRRPVYRLKKAAYDFIKTL